jgi:hypothetical protein
MADKWLYEAFRPFDDRASAAEFQVETAALLTASSRSQARRRLSRVEKSLKKPGLHSPFSLNQIGTLSRRHLAQFVSAIDTSGPRTETFSK